MGVHVKIQTLHASVSDNGHSLHEISRKKILFISKDLGLYTLCRHKSQIEMKVIS
jgi:hypothetical protein